MSREISVRVWQASLYNPQHQDVDAEKILKTLKYTPKSPSYDNTSLKVLLSTIADWSQNVLSNDDPYNDEFLLSNYIEMAQRAYGNNFPMIGFNHLPENDYLYYDLLATLVTKAKELDLIILIDMYGKEIIIYPDGTSQPMSNYVGYIFQQNKETRETKESYHNALAFETLLTMPRPISVEQGKIFIEACFKDYAKRNGLEFKGEIYGGKAGTITIILAVNGISIVCTVDIGRRGDYIFGIEARIVPDYQEDVLSNTCPKAGSQKLTTYQPSLEPNYQVNSSMITIYYKSTVEGRLVPQSDFETSNQKTPQQIYDVLCHYIDRVINVAKSSNSYLDFLDRIYQDSNNILHNYYWLSIPKDSIERAAIRLLWYAVVHRMRMLQTMATLLHPELPKMVDLLTPEITFNFDNVKTEFSYSESYLLPYLRQCQTSQDFFDYIMRIYEDGLKGINYPPLNE